MGGSVRQLGATFRELRRRPLTLLFLVTYLLYNDGVQTVTNVSAQYGSEELDLSQSTLITAILVVQFIAFGGALALGRLAARYGTKRTILGSLVVWMVVIGIAYFLQKGSALQFYAVALAIGFVLGGTQALSRSLFSQLIPAGKEAEYFGFYEISDRGTSWLGPAPVRADLPADRLLPVRHLQPGLLLRRGRRPAVRLDLRRADRRGRQHPAGAAVTPSSRTAPLPLPTRCRPPVTAAGTRRRRTWCSSTARWTAGSPRWRCRSTTTSSRQGRHGLLLTQGDRSGTPQISSRVGPAAARPIEIDAGTDLRLLVRDRWADGHRVDYLIVDEAQFLTADQVEQLAELVDESHVDVYAFGLTTDFRTRLFTGTQRLLELADDVQRVQVEVLCWCGLPGLLNARVVDGAMVREGATVVVADTAPRRTARRQTGAADAVRYQVLCRRHYVRGQLGPTPPARASSPCADRRRLTRPGVRRACRSPPYAMMSEPIRRGILRHFCR